MATQQLPAQPSLKSLKNQAKQLLHDHQAGRKSACVTRIRVWPICRRMPSGKSVSPSPMPCW